MSSFICSAKHFNSIEKNLIDLLKKNDFSIPYNLRDLLPTQYYNPYGLSEEARKRELRPFIDELRQLNVLAVTLQYKDHYQGTLDKEIEDQNTIICDRSKAKELTPLGLYNALRSLNYQIEVEHIQELRPLTMEEETSMRFLDEFTQAIARYIISNLPEDKTNVWTL